MNTQATKDQNSETDPQKKDARPNDSSGTKDMSSKDAPKEKKE